MAPIEWLTTSIRRAPVRCFSAATSRAISRAVSTLDASLS
jgi:hypothetical protein